MTKKRKGNGFLKVFSGVSLAVVLGGAVACIVPESRNYILDNLAPHSNEYKLIEEENKNLSSDNETKQNTIDLLNNENEKLQEQINSMQSSIKHNYEYIDYDFITQNEDSLDSVMMSSSEEHSNWLDKSTVLDNMGKLSNIVSLNATEKDKYQITIDNQTSEIIVTGNLMTYEANNYTFNINYLIDGVGFAEDSLQENESYRGICNLIVNEETQSIDITINYISLSSFNSVEISVDYNVVLEDLSTKGELLEEYDIYGYSWGGISITPEFRLFDENGIFKVGSGATGCNFIMVEKGATASFENAKLISSNFVIENGVATIEIVE